MEREQMATALQEWRDAQRRVDHAIDGEQAALTAEVERTRNRFRHMSTEHMIELLDEIHEAENRRKSAVPSTAAFHQAAKDEMSIASDIYDWARMNDQDTPKRES